MIKTLRILLIVALATIFSCKHLKKHLGIQDENKTEKVSIIEADKIEYNHHGPTVAPKYNRGYTITITPGELVVIIKSYDSTLLSQKRPFTKEKFQEVINSFKNLKEEGEPKQGDVPVGGSSDAIIFYQDGEEIFKGSGYCGNAKNYSGADIDLSYLVNDLQKLIASTK